MTIASELAATQEYLADAYNAIVARGGTAPEHRNMANLVEAVESIQGGGRPPLPEYPYQIDQEQMKNSEYGVLAYLRDDEVHYYTATSDTDVTNLGSNTATRTFKTLDDGFAITTSNLLAYGVGSSTTSLPLSFLYNCTLLQEFYFSSNSSLTSIGTQFLWSCAALNCPITIPEGVTTISDRFLQGCSSLNQPVILPSGVTKIGAYFLNACTTFNLPLVVPDGVTEIGDYFLYDCKNFDSPITLPDTLAKIGARFMNQCEKFNQSLVLPDTLVSIGTASSGYFMNNCYLFNQPLQVPAGLAATPPYFLMGCRAFDSQIEFRNPSIRIGDCFLYMCSSFNQPLSLPSQLTRIGTYFLAGCADFLQPLTIPDTVTYIGERFMMLATSSTSHPAFVGPIDVGSGTGRPTDENSLTTQNKSDVMYSTGVTLTGTNAQTWKDGLPDRTNSAPYRKLIVAEEAETA